MKPAKAGVSDTGELRKNGRGLIGILADEFGIELAFSSDLPSNRFNCGRELVAIEWQPVSKSAC